MGLLERQGRYRGRDTALEAGGARFRDPLWFAKISIFVVFGVLIVQLLRMQVLEGETYQQRAENNRLRALVLPPDRGLIYDAQGVQLVENAARYNAILVPADLPADGDERHQVFVELQDLIGLQVFEVEQMVKEAESSGAPFSTLVIKRDLTREQAVMLESAVSRLPGVELEVQQARKYLGPDSLSHIIGYIGLLDAGEYSELNDSGYQLNDVVGKSGLEASFESLLRGRPGVQQAEVDAAGNIVERFREEAPEAGDSLQLTIDVEFQDRVEEILASERFMCGSEFGCSPTAAAAVMNVKTGEILAMVSLPTFDANVFNDTHQLDQVNQWVNDPTKPLLNHVIGDQNTPGSTFKVITATAALETGVATPHTSVYTDGALEYEDLFGNTQYFRDWSPGGFGMLDLYGGIAQSSNQYFFTIAGGDPKQGFNDAIGPTRLAEWAFKFGLGQPTGIGLPGEALGVMPSPRWKEQVGLGDWFQADTYYSAIGQGDVAASPMQMLMVVAAIANDGVQMKPQLVSAVLDENGKVVERFEPEVLRRVNAKPETFEAIRAGMRLSVTNGVGSPAAVPAVPVAGKTGTAEFGQPNSWGKYLEHGWFIGFAPYEDPEVAVVVYYELGGGNATASPAAGAILNAYFNELGR